MSVACSARWVWYPITHRTSAAALVTYGTTATIPGVPTVAIQGIGVSF
jgi:hypothetical protein